MEREQKKLITTEYFMSLLMLHTMMLMGLGGYVSDGSQRLFIAVTASLAMVVPFSIIAVTAMKKGMKPQACLFLLGASVAVITLGINLNFDALITNFQTQGASFLMSFMGIPAIISAINGARKESNFAVIGKNKASKLKN